MNPKLEKSFTLVCRTCRNESIDIYHIAIWSIFMPYYYLEKFSVFGQKVENELEIWKKLSITL